MPKPVLVAYATKHNSTAEIAEAIAEELRAHGFEVDCRPAAEIEDLERYGAVVLGSAVYMRRWRREARRLLRRGRRELAARPLWAFSSGPCGQNPDPSWGEPPKVASQLDDLGVRQRVVFGGRLPTHPRNLIERAMVRNSPPENRDMRDWDSIRAWAREIAGDLRTGAADDEAG